MPEFEIGNNKEYEIEAIQNSAIYAKKAGRHLLRLYYLIIWKGYPEKENTWKPSTIVIYLWKMVSNFYKDYPKKLIVILVSLNSTLPIAKPIVKFLAK